jgi:hypothetical protein
MARKKKSPPAKKPPNDEADPRSPNWEPNRRSFYQGRPYVELQLKKAGLDPDAGIFTSRDAKAQSAMRLLKTLNSPPGFEKWQLPFAFFNPTNSYITVGEPDSKVKPHAHKEGSGMRFILEGSFVLNGQNLMAGDWFYIPEGAEYSFTTGHRGVKLFASYEC